MVQTIHIHRVKVKITRDCVRAVAHVYGKILEGVFMAKIKLRHLLPLLIIILAVFIVSAVKSTDPHVTVTGTKAGDVVGTITGGGYINVVNNGGFVTATETGTGTINIVNNGGVIAATNTGNGVMTIYNTSTAAVTVTNTENGNIRVNASGSTAITLTYSDGLDHIYPELPSATPVPADSHIAVSGKNASDVATVITGGGYINVVNNGAHVSATQTGLGTIKITNNGGIMAATNTGNGVMTINSTCTGAVAVTNTGNGNITVNATGAAPVSLTYTDGANHTYP